MAVSMRANTVSARAAARPQRRPAVHCQAVFGENNAAKAQIAAAAMAAAALLSAAPVEAGVVLTQPELKKVFQSTEEAQPVKERPFRVPGKAPEAAAKKADAPKQKKKDEVSKGDLGLDPRAVALPASIAAIGALGFAATKIDDGFSDWLNEKGVLVRDSSNWAGFEEELKPATYFWNPEPSAAGGRAGTVKKTGTKVVKGRK